MARKRGRLDFKNEAQQLVRQFKTENTGWKRERLQALKLLLETEMSYDQVAQIVGRHTSRVKVWANTFRNGGLDALLTRGKGSGRRPKMTNSAQEELVEKLRIGAFRTASQVEKWLREEHGISYGKNSIYYQLGKLAGRLKVPRPSHQKKDLKKVEEFKTTLADKMMKLEIPAQKQVSLWVYDEMRYGLHPLLRKMWSLIGTRVIAPVNRRFKWGYVFGAISVEGGQSEFLYTDGVSKEVDKYFIEQISKNDPDKIHIIIGDGAGFHHKEGLNYDDEIPQNVRMLTLPPYSPELNPIEKLWDIVKDDICTVNWPSLKELEDKMTEKLQSIWEKVEGFSSLFTNSYLKTELNALNRADKSSSFC